MNLDSTIDPTEESPLQQSPLQFDFAGASHIGLKRKQNQDHFIVAELKRLLNVVATDIPLENCDALYGSEPGHLLVVADGMGGHDEGEIASRTAVKLCVRYVLDMMHWFLKLSANNEDDFVDELSACLNAVQSVFREGRTPSDRSLGTTVTLAYIIAPRMYVIHAGDSRCYLVREEELIQLTTDHTIAQRLLSKNAISAEQFTNSRWRHVLWNCVGGGHTAVEPEVVRINLQRGDQLLICSDGLTGMVTDQAILATLIGEPSASAAVSSLIEQANLAGGSDNITAVVGRCDRQTTQVQHQLSGNR